MASTTGALTAYFATHMGFVHNAANAPTTEFDRLIAFLGHAPKSSAFKRERRLYVEAFIRYVNATYGEGRASLGQWQDLCRACAIDPAPASITKCRQVRDSCPRMMHPWAGFNAETVLTSMQALRRVYVNIFDAIDALITGGQATRFSDLPALRRYTKNSHKVCPIAHAKSGGVVKDLLRPLF